MATMRYVVISSLILFVALLPLSGQCQLGVNANAALNRTGANEMIGAGTLTIGQTVVGDWSVTLTIELEYNAGSGYSKVDEEEITFSWPNGTGVGSSQQVLLVTALEPYGTGTYRIKQSAEGKCGGGAAVHPAAKPDLFLG
jgi:hypothetical protein